MSFADFIADRRAVWDRGEVWVEFFVTDPNGSEEVLRYSLRGTPSVAGLTDIPANVSFDKRVVEAPSLQQALWAPGAIHGSSGGGGSLPEPGRIVLRNADGGLDQYRKQQGYVWRGRTCRVWYVDSADPVGSISTLPVIDCVIEDAGFGIDDVVVDLRSREALFDVDVSERVYRGTGPYVLELDSTASACSSGHGSPAVLDITSGGVTAEMWFWSETMAGASFLGWIGGTGRPFSLFVNSSGNVVVRASVGGTNEDVTSTATLSTKKPYHLAGVIDDTNNVVRIYIWDDDAQTLTTEVTTSAFSGARDAAAGGATFQIRAQGGDVTWFDECRVWSEVRSAEGLSTYRFTPIEAGDEPASLVFYARCNDGMGTTVTDQANANNGTLSGGTSTWLRGVWGSVELAGAPVPDLWGQRWGLKPILVDGPSRVYQWNSEASQACDSVYEGGNELGTPPYTDAASLRAFITTTPAAGDVLTYKARGLLKLGREPTFPIMCSARGHNGGALGYVNNAADIIRDIVTRRGPKLADPGDLDTASFTALETANAAVLGLWLPDPVTVVAALDRVAQSVGAWWGYERGSDLFHVERWEGPAGSADHEFDETDIVDIRPADSRAVVYRVVVRYRELDDALEPGEVVGAVKGTDGWVQWTREWRERQATDWDLRKDHPGDASVVMVVDTLMQQSVDAYTEAERLLALLAGVQEPYDVVLRHPGVEVSVGETVSLSFTDILGNARLGLDGTGRWAVMRTDDRLAAGVVTVGAWRKV